MEMMTNDDKPWILHDASSSGVKLQAEYENALALLSLSRSRNADLQEKVDKMMLERVALKLEICGLKNRLEDAGEVNGLKSEAKSVATNTGSFSLMFAD